MLCESGDVKHVTLLSCRLANSDLLSLDPFGPTLAAGSSYSAPSSTGNAKNANFTLTPNQQRVAVAVPLKDDFKH